MEKIKTLVFESPINEEYSISPKMVHLGKFESYMELFYDKENNNGCIIWEIEKLERLVEIGLWFDGNNVVDYDGVFSLPEQAIQMLNDCGFNTEQVC